MNETMLQPITIELVRGLKGYERTSVLNRYHTWLNSVREHDKQQVRKEEIKTVNFKRRDKIKEWKLKNKERLKGYGRRYYATKTKKVL